MIKPEENKYYKPKLIIAVTQYFWKLNMVVFESQFLHVKRTCLSKPPIQIIFFYFGGCRFPNKCFASQSHVDFTCRARDHLAGQWISSSCNKMVVSCVAKWIQGHRRQMIVSHHLKEEEKPVYFSYFLFTQVNWFSLCMHQEWRMGTTGVPRSHSISLHWVWLVSNYFP